MLVTSYLTRPGTGGVPIPTRLVANDPWAGQQIFIDIDPSDTPAYQQAVLNPTAAGQPAAYRKLTGGTCGTGCGFNFTFDIAYGAVAVQ